jgi:hypothetical protein
MRRRTVALTALAAGFAGCNAILGIQEMTFTPEDAGGEGDGGVGADVTAEAQAPDPTGFTLGASPALVVLDPGDPAATVTVNVTRGGAFTGSISFVVDGGAPGVTTSTPLPVDGGASTTSFTFLVDVTSPARGDYPFVVTGTDTSGPAFSTTPVTLRVAGVLSADGGVIVAGPGSILVKAWGAGGGGGVAAGGGGGFVSAGFDLASATRLTIVEGTGGGAGTPDAGGGGGGGFSGMMSGGAWWLIAGGGGGGGFDGTGGGGGGLSGENGGSCKGGGAGNQTGGGQIRMCPNAQDDAPQPGSALQGGNGADFGSGSAAGVPGGGVGGIGNNPDPGGGGGGGGWFGGAGGSYNGNSGGGGGGSGHVADVGANATLHAAIGMTAAETADPDYGSGVPGYGGSGAGVSGSNGRVVVRLLKK